MKVAERFRVFRIRRVVVAAMSVAGLGACGGGGGGSAPPPPPPPAVTISGQVQYEFVPPGLNCQGLDFAAIRLRPVRQATIEFVAGNTVLKSDVTDEDGGYALSVDAETQGFLRVRAELKRTGAPAWSVEVRDNFDDSMPADQRPPLPQRPMYVLDGAVFNAGSADSTRNLTATTGWNASTSSYAGPRAAAPFAILDTVYASMQLVLAEDPQVVFEPLDVFWSIHNTPTDADPDIDLGELPTSFYSSDNRLFLLGMDGVDTEEFDDHVIAHEWGHYFEDVFSRSDSIGGAHSLGQRLDMRVAFGEGFATALSGIALDSPQYCDTLWFQGQMDGFRIDIENTPVFDSPGGWYNELSVMRLLYDLWDEGPADDDGVSIGFAPIYAVMSGAQAITPAFTSIFSFARALKAENPADAPLIDALLATESITADGAYGSTETNAAGNSEDVLPVYTVVPDGSTFEICSNSQFDRTAGDTLAADGNKLSEHRYLRMTLDAPASLSVEIRITDETVAMLPPDDPEDPVDQSDPDIFIYHNGQILNQFVGDDLQGLSGAANEEIFTTPDPLAAGDYVMDLNEFRYEDSDTAPGFPARSCFDVTITTAP